MQLFEAIHTYLVVIQAEGSGFDEMESTGSMLNSFLSFTGDLPVAELDNLHIMLYLSTEWVKVKQEGFRYTLRNFLIQYLSLFRFFRWMEIEDLARLDFYRKWREKLRPEDKPGMPDQENPPDNGGFSFRSLEVLNLSARVLIGDPGSPSGENSDLDHPDWNVPVG